MKKIFSLLGLLLGGFAIVAYAQVGGSVSQPNYFKYVGTSIVPTNASSTIGTSTQSVAGGYFTDLIISGTCTGCTAGSITASTTEKVNITNSESDVSYVYPTWVASNGSQIVKTSSSTLKFFPIAGLLQSTIFSGNLSGNLSGTASTTGITNTGGYWDSLNNIGSSNNILTSTGTSTKWINTLGIANGGTNVSSFLSPANGISPLIFFDGSKLTGNSTITHLGYATSTDTVYTGALSISAPQTTVATFTNTGSQSSLGGAGMIGYANPSTAMLSGSRLGFYSFGGTTDTASTTVNASGMAGFATENWSATNNGSRVEIYTTPNGTTTAQRRTVATFGQDGLFSALFGATVTGQTTLANASSTALTVSGNTVLATTTINGDLTMNGGIIPRTVNYTASTSVTINTDTTDIATITVAHATTTFETPTGTLWNGKMFEIMLTATTTRGLGWSTGFASSTDLAMPITTASGTAKYIYEYRSQSAKWELSGLLTGFAN